MKIKKNHGKSRGFYGCGGRTRFCLCDERFLSSVLRISPVGVPGDCPCRRSGCVPRRPRPLARVTSSATGSAPLAPRTLTCGSSPTCIKIWDAPMGYPIFWHILHNLIQCNANRRSVAFFLKAEFCVALVRSLLTYVVLYAVQG